MAVGQMVRMTTHILVRLPLYMVPRSAVVPILWGPLRGKRWINGSSIFRCWLGFYEWDKQACFARHVAPGAVVFDIGANVGFYTLLASKLVGAEGKVIAFEPVPSNVDFLKRHLALNAVDNVRVVEAAVSDLQREVTFQEGETNSVGRIAEGGNLRVPSVTLDTLIATGSLPPPRVIKMDIEGAEYRALMGAKETLIRHRPILFLATHDPEVHEQCCALLRSCGYVIQPIDGRPLESSRENLGTLAGLDEPSELIPDA